MLVSEAAAEESACGVSTPPPPAVPDPSEHRDFLEEVSLDPLFLLRPRLPHRDGLVTSLSTFAKKAISVNGPHRTSMPAWTFIE